MRGRERLLLALGAALSAVTILQGVGPHDEGLMLQAANRIAAGEWPYRDFWFNYGPGQPVVLAGLVKVLGPSLLSWRVLRVALDAIVALLAYRLVLRAGASERWALLAWLGAAGAMAWPSGPGPNPAALTFGLGALLAVPRRPGLAGVLAGVAAVFRPEIGAVCALGAALAGGGLRTALVAVGAAVAGWLPFFVVAPGDLLDQVVGFLGIQNLQRLPFPVHASTDPNKLLEGLFPLALLVCAGGWVLWALARRGRLRAPWIAVAPLALVGLAYLLGRADEFHLVPLSLALCVLLGVAAAREPSAWVRWVLGAGLVVIALHGLDRQGGRVLHPEADAAVPGGIGDGVRTTGADAAALRVVVARVRALVPPGAPVLVAPPRYDRVRFGDPLLNVILDRPNPTRYDVMQPGVVTTATVQREMIGDLERARPRVVVRWLAPAAGRAEPNGSGRSSGVFALDRWIAARYRPLMRAGDYLLLVPRTRK